MCKRVHHKDNEMVEVTAKTLSLNTTTRRVTWWRGDVVRETERIKMQQAYHLKS